MDNVIRDWWLSVSHIGWALLPVNDGKWLEEKYRSSSANYVLVIPGFWIPIIKLYLIPAESYDVTVSHILKFKALSGLAKLAAAIGGVAALIYSSRPDVLYTITLISIAFTAPVAFSAIVERYRIRGLYKNWIRVTPINSAKRKIRLINILFPVMILILSFIKDTINAIPHIQKSATGGASSFAVKKILDVSIGAIPEIITRSFVMMTAIRLAGKAAGSFVPILILGSGFALTAFEISGSYYKDYRIYILLICLMLSVTICITTLIRKNNGEVLALSNKALTENKTVDYTETDARVALLLGLAYSVSESISLTGLINLGGTYLSFLFFAMICFICIISIKYKNPILLIGSLLYLTSIDFYYFVVTLDINFNLAFIDNIARQMYPEQFPYFHALIVFFAALSSMYFTKKSNSDASLNNSP